jgi:uncharacterized protein (TIGR03083 family)
MNLTATASAHDVARPPIDEALDVVESELAALLALLRELDAADWQRPTACTGWTVHDVVAHVIGQLESGPRPIRMTRRLLQARRHGRVGVLNRQNSIQVRDRATMPEHQLVDELGHWGGKGVRAARRMPAWLRRRLRISLLFPEEAKLLPENSFDYMLGVLTARDTWMHRLDIAAATGRTPTVDQHDAHVVEQVVRDLADFWSGPPVVLDLSGPAGGRWIIGSGKPVAAVKDDALTFMRQLSGRPTDQAATVEGDPTAAAALLSMHIEF